MEPAKLSSTDDGIPNIVIPEPTDPRLGIPATDLCPECGGTGWIKKRLKGYNNIWLADPFPCHKCTPKAFST